MFAKEPRTTLNADEECARGATIMCAILSSTIALNFKIEESQFNNNNSLPTIHNISNSIMHKCTHCNVDVIDTDLAKVTSKIKIFCGSCPSDKGDRLNGLIVAIFNRFNVYCFICKKVGLEIKLARYFSKAIICEQCCYIWRNKKKDN